MAIVIVKFGQYREYKQSSFEGKQIDFPFEIIEQQYIDTPRQSSNTHRGYLIVKIVGTLVDTWDLEKFQLAKVLFEIAKEWLQENLQTASVIEGNKEIWVTTRTHSTQCPYDINHIEEPNGAVIEIEVNRQIGF
jgi:hypothetical protein